MSSAEAKVVILGSGGVGKSALCIQFTKGKYVERYDPTIEDSYRKQIEVDGQARMLDILDTAGQEEYTAMRTQYMKSGQGFVIVYAVDDQDSFSEATAIWDQIVKTKDTSKVPCVLVGNKCDLVASVPRADAEAFAAEKNIAFLEASAKEKINVDEIFTTLVRKINEILGGGPAPAPVAAEPTTAEVASSSAPATGGSAPAESAPKPAAPAPAPAKKPKKKGLCMIL